MTYTHKCDEPFPSIFKGMGSLMKHQFEFNYALPCHVIHTSMHAILPCLTQVFTTVYNNLNALILHIQWFETFKEG